MKGDFTRLTFDPAKHYAAVLMQQGRVQDPADWIEEGAIHRYRRETETRDVIGQCGAPVHAAGFGITSDGAVLTIGQGRYYVDGLLCENEHDVTYANQPDLPEPPEPLTLLKKKGAAIVYLDVWARHITALDNPRLREVALGGPDTATRMKIVWQVKILPVDAPTADAAERKRLTALQRKLAKQLTQAQETGNDALAAEINQQVAEVEAALATLDTHGLACDDDFAAWDSLIAPGTAKLNARTQQPSPGQDPCFIPPAVGYRRLENQLYRVEIHQPGAPGTATFKWSRDNGVVVTTIEKISGKEVTVHDVGPDDQLGFANGQWVEISDDGLELNGLPGQLVQIDTVDSARRVITLKNAPATLAANPTGVDTARHPKLRRWDQHGNKAEATGVKIESGFLPLEDGIEIELTGQHFSTGDYWLIPARTATGEIEWPPYAVPNSNPIPQPPQGIGHHFCRLALVRLVNGKLHVQDCRNLFPPLTELPTASAATALHVVGTNWSNDDLFATAALLKDGLRIQLDAAPDPATAGNDSVIVTLDMPSQNEQLSAVNALDTFVLVGDVSIDPSDPATIVWRLVQTVRPGLTDRPGFGATMGGRAVNLTTAVITRNQFRMHVTVKGRLISRPTNQGRIYLDGQVFGTPVVRAADDVRMILSFPSGDGVRASDFESWFYLGSGEPQRVHDAVLMVIGRSPRFAGFSPTRMDNVMTAFNLAIERATLLGLLPDSYRVQEATFDQEKARTALHQADVGTLFVAGLADQAFAAAADFIRDSMAQIGIESQITPVDDLQTEIAVRMAAGDFFDLVLCDQALMPALEQAGLTERATLVL